MRVKRQANVTKEQIEWESIQWDEANRIVRNLRHRIFRASQAGDLKKVRSLQKLMLRSRSNSAISVRRVTQINSGKKTPGIDKVVAKDSFERGQLLNTLSEYTLWKAKPTRRVYIPKANKQPHPLGIPVILDRSLQAMVKNALEPYWEAKFEGSCYGFRPGRGCHDAIEKIFGYVRPSKGKREWILDADLKGAFNEINHEFLLKTIAGFPGRELIKQWLKAGYMEDGEWNPTESGTPQGGVISPLLLNIALHGIGDALKEQRYSQRYNKFVEYGSPKRDVIIYADDLVVLCESKEEAEKSRKILDNWLRPRGLQFSEEKTRIVHISEGFDFLGFNVRQYSTPRSSRSGKKLIIKPSKASIMKLRKNLKDKWLSMKGNSPIEIIGKFNSIIRGWANYFRTSCAKRIFGKMDNWMFKREMRYVKYRHPNKSMRWMRNRYWGKFNEKRNDKWVFGDKETGAYMLRFNWFPIERHTLVKGSSSPDDPSLKSYWESRKRKDIKNLKPQQKILAKRQEFRCPECGNDLLNGEGLLEYPIIRPKVGGSPLAENRYLMHYDCQQLRNKHRRQNLKETKDNFKRSEQSA